MDREGLIEPYPSLFNYWLLIDTIGYWEKGSHCLQLCTHCQSKQAPIDSYKSKAIMSVPVKLSHKTQQKT